MIPKPMKTDAVVSVKSTNSSHSTGDGRVRTPKTRMPKTMSPRAVRLMRLMRRCGSTGLGRER